MRAEKERAIREREEDKRQSTRAEKEKGVCKGEEEGSNQKDKKESNVGEKQGIKERERG